MSRLDTSYLRTLLDPARHISLLIKSQPNFDDVAAALGLKMALESTGKTVRVVCPDPMLVEFNRLVGVDTVSSVFGSRNLIISFPEQTEHVDKVSYKLENGELQLVISPKSDSPELDHQKLKFISGSAKTDLMVLLHVNQLSELGQIYTDANEHFQNTTLVSISHETPGENYTLHQFHDTDSSSLSELVTHLIDSLGLPLDGDSASNLFAGLEKATGNFQSALVSVSTFEAAAVLMRKGARRHQPLSAGDFPVGSIPTASQPPPVPADVPPPAPPKPASQTGYGTDSTFQPEPKKTKDKKTAPADWYEPKIYKGPMLQ